MAQPDTSSLVVLGADYCFLAGATAKLFRTTGSREGRSTTPGNRWISMLTLWDKSALNEIQFQNMNMRIERTLLRYWGQLAKAHNPMIVFFFFKL